MSNIPPLTEQGLVLINCMNCHSIYYDLCRPNRWALHCVYCGHRFKV